jgi:transposase/IS5 family transposase
MRNHTRFKPYQPNQLFLLPPDMKDWLPNDHLVYFVMDVVGELDLCAIYQRYDSSKGGQPPFDPKMMVSLLFYAYCIGLPSSRKIEKATYERVAFRILTADQHPDHDTIADFRKRHLDCLSGSFVQILRLCQEVGLVKLGHVSLDGTKVKANASKHKAMSYGRMEKKAEELEAEVKRLLAEAQAVDDAEDTKYGKGKRGDELPKELRFKQDRLKKIKEAMKSLEQEAKVKAEVKREEVRLKELSLQKEGKKRKGKKPKDPTDKPDSKAQRNFTDPESRIMKDGASKSFEQAYNCQAAVDEESQIIVATNVTQQPNDKQQLEPLVEEIKKNTDGERPEKLSGDNGYFSESNVKHLEDEGIDGYIATDRQKHGDVRQSAGRGRIPKDATTQERMARKLRTKKGRETYSKRKQIVEPVFGQIKESRGFRRFLLRGLENVSAEWDLICLTHNLLKLFRSGLTVKTA